MIDQMTLGHRFLKAEFGFDVKTGWQIDPFGHSSTNARLSAEMGFDSQYFARVDYEARDCCCVLYRSRNTHAMAQQWVVLAECRLSNLACQHHGQGAA